MSSKGVAISYGDVSPGAKENFKSEAEQSQFDTLNQLQLYNAEYPDYGNPCELYSVALDGKAKAFPSAPPKFNIGFISKIASDENGAFPIDGGIVLTLTAGGQYSSQGFTITFDTYNNIYCSYLNIKWYRDNQLIDEEDFTPDNSVYFCEKKVSNFDKVKISFYKMNMPDNRLKIRGIEFGYGTMFLGGELQNVYITQEMNPITSELGINTTDFILVSKSKREYTFQERQPIKTYFNGQLKSSTFVKSSKRNAKNVWEVQSEDYIGLMDDVTFYGGMYNGEVNAYELLVEIFNTAKIPYTINEDLKDKLIYGYLPIATCRDALMQVAFAVQNVVDTSEREDVIVYKLQSDVKQKIPLERISQGQNFTTSSDVSRVELTVHTYAEAALEEIVLYDASKSGTGKNIFIKFSQPMHDIYIRPLDGNNKIIESHVNYAIINASSEDCILRGDYYHHTTEKIGKDNPLYLENNEKNAISVDNATLVSKNNANEVLDSCFDWLLKTTTINQKIAERKNVVYGEKIRYGQKKYGEFKYGEKTPDIITYDEPIHLGDNIETETSYMGNITGRVIRQAFHLNGNILSKEVVMK